VIDITALEATVRFHGHLCAELAFGIRAAEISRRRLGNRTVGPAVMAIVDNDRCSIDAIQFLTGATVGQGNLIARPYGKFVFTFVRRRDGKAIRLSLCPGAVVPPDPEWEALAIRSRLRTFAKAEEERFAILQRHRAERVLSTPLHRLYDVTEVQVEVPSRPHASGRLADCDSCGEVTADACLHSLHGRALCSPCLDEVLELESLLPRG